MLSLILFGVSLVDVVADAFDFSDNVSSKCVLEEDKYTSPCVNVSFASNIELYAALFFLFPQHIILLLDG